MIGPISRAPVRPVRPIKGRSHRFEVEAEATIESQGEVSATKLRDISETGASLLGSAPVLTNDLFVELHLEGQRSLRAEVVREFEGGYAVKFDNAGARGTLSQQELNDFRSAVSPGI